MAGSLEGSIVEEIDALDTVAVDAEAGSLVGAIGSAVRVAAQGGTRGRDRS